MTPQAVWWLGTLALTLVLSAAWTLLCRAVIAAWDRWERRRAVSPGRQEEGKL